MTGNTIRRKTKVIPGKERSLPYHASEILILVIFFMLFKRLESKFVRQFREQRITAPEPMRRPFAITWKSGLRVHEKINSQF
jgi:hypothetical protein